MTSKIDNKYNKKKTYKSTKQVNVSLMNLSFDLAGFSKMILFND